MMEGTQETRGMLRRMMRNKLVIVDAKPAETPSEVVFGWAEEFGVTRVGAIELLERLRQAIPFDEDGRLNGSAIVDAIDRQANLVHRSNWSFSNKLRFAAERLREQFTHMGLL